MDIRDYASMIDSIGTDEKKERINKPKAKPTIEVEYSDMVDFVLAKKTKNTKKLLMVMPSKGKVCVSDGKVAEEATDALLSSFFAGNVDIQIGVAKTVYMQGNRGSLKENIVKVRALMEKGCAGVLKYGVLTNIPELSEYRNRWNWRGIDDKFLVSCEDDLQFALRMMQKEKMKMDSHKFYSIMRVVESVKNAYGVDIARYFIECMTDSKVQIEENCSFAVKEFTNKSYNLNPRKLIEYMCYRLPEQGITVLKDGYNGSLGDYRDYLSMEYQMYGDVKDKYPRYLRTQHDISQMKFNLVKDEIVERNFASAVKKHADLTYTDGKYTISIPEKAADLVEEGRRLCHCVASYVDRVANENTMIVFCRMNLDLENPYCTVEVQNGRVTQARCLQNAKPNKETLDFIAKWAKKKELEYAV